MANLSYDYVRTKVYRSGFTVVELLVVVVIIGILAAVTIVSYGGIARRAIAVSVLSDLNGASKRLGMYQVENGKYPLSIDDCPTPSAVNICLEPSSDGVYTYTYNNSTSSPLFNLTATVGGISYGVANNTAPIAYSDIICPSGFVVVPGSATYGTSNFCVMKYEAKQVGTSTVPVSQASGFPWATITQADAAANSQNVAGCTGCHLITEAEWLTIAQNVLSVASNWSGESVGSGYIYSGHNDNSPSTYLEADVDSNGYTGTGNSYPSNQRRTLTLSNGEIIWDLAGNVWEWTAGQSSSGLPGVAAGGWNWREWTNVTVAGTLTPNVFPIATAISGASSWTSANGIGQLYSNSDDISLHGFGRGGSWGYGIYTGVLCLSFNGSPSNLYSSLGFRVAK